VAGGKNRLMRAAGAYWYLPGITWTLWLQLFVSLYHHAPTRRSKKNKTINFIEKKNQRV
jgi:hypothetical protein